jgi:NNP family nitrate/nitrite transporter-like MFS transporter
LGGFIIPPFLGATVDALGSRGYAGGFFAYVILAVIAIAVSWNFHHLDLKTRRAPPPALLFGAGLLPS